jgi:hypothetical protein
MRNNNEDTGRITRKIDNLQQLQYMANQEVITKLILQWCEDRPDNDQLESFRKSWMDTIFYIHKLETDRETYGLAYSQLMESKNMEIERLGELLSKVVDQNIDLDTDIVH